MQRRATRSPWSVVARASTVRAPSPTSSVGPLATARPARSHPGIRGGRRRLRGSTGPALVIGVSHEGATWATMRALETARAGGATTALITVSGRSPGAALADIVVETGELDRSWCHTVGYLSPILAGDAVGRRGCGATAVTARRSAPMLPPAWHPPPVSCDGGRRGRRCRPLDRIVVIGSGTDRIAARELVAQDRGRDAYPGCVPRCRDGAPRPSRRNGRADRRSSSIAPEPRAGRARARGASARSLRALRANSGSAPARSSRASTTPRSRQTLTPAGRVVVPATRHERCGDRRGPSLVARRSRSSSSRSGSPATAASTRIRSGATTRRICAPPRPPARRS